MFYCNGVLPKSLASIIFRVCDEGEHQLFIKERRSRRDLGNFSTPSAVAAGGEDSDLVSGEFCPTACSSLALSVSRLHTTRAVLLRRPYVRIPGLVSRACGRRMIRCDNCRVVPRCRVQITDNPQQSQPSTVYCLRISMLFVSDCPLEQVTFAATKSPLS